MPLIALTDIQTRTLLHHGVAGRVAFCTPQGPNILPVNYAVVDDTIVIRTTEDTALAEHGPGARLAFEVDQFDYVAKRGWSVVARGPAERIDHLRDLAHVYAVWLPEPWADGPKDFFLRIACDQITGRRLGRDWNIGALLPVTAAPEPKLLGGPVREDSDAWPKPIR